MKKEIGERVKLVREQFGYNRNVFSKNLNISQSTLWAIENGRSGVSHEVQKKLSDTFKVNLNWLITGIGKIFYDDAMYPEYLIKRERKIDLSTKIEDCPLSGRLKNILLYDVHIETVRGLTSKKIGEMIQLRNMGKKSIIEFFNFIEKHHLI